MTRLFLIFAIILQAPVLMADLETTAVLPEGVYSSKFIYGSYTGLDQRYDSAGLLEGVADQYQLNLTGSSLSKLDPQLSQLVQVLNGFSSNEQLGNELSMGTLQFKALPVVNYFVPELAYGLSPKFSIGLGIPIIHYQNSMSVSSTGGNVAALSQYLAGASPEVTSALAQLVNAAQNMTGALNSILSSRGYFPIRNVDYTTLGDLQVSGIYKYYTSDKWKLALRPFVQLPTGQPDNPDDLEDFEFGGQPAVGLYSIHEYSITPKLNWVSSVGYQANIPDRVEMRVPTGPDDYLPTPDRKELVFRQTGNYVYLESGASYDLYRPLQVSAFYDFTEKDPDWYGGSHGWDYGLLSTDTGMQIHQIKAVLEFSTVDWYLKKLISVPFLFGYVYGNTIFAVNYPDVISHQLYVRMFF